MQDPSHRFKGDVMDLRLDIERRKRFAGREREDKRSPGGSRGPSRDRSSEKSGKRHKKSKYVCFTFTSVGVAGSACVCASCISVMRHQRRECDEYRDTQSCPVEPEQRRPDFPHPALLGGGIRLAALPLVHIRDLKM